MVSDNCTMKVERIRNGTVIDHITGGKALHVCRILGIPGLEGRYTVSILINANSKKMGKKDILKIEERFLLPMEIDKIALVSPQATVNIIRNFENVQKHRVSIPDVIEGLLPCENLSCITNVTTPKEPIKPSFRVESKSPLVIKCMFCGRLQKDPVDRIFLPDS